MTGEPPSAFRYLTANVKPIVDELSISVVTARTHLRHDFDRLRRDVEPDFGSTTRRPALGVESTGCCGAIRYFVTPGYWSTRIAEIDVRSAA